MHGKRNFSAGACRQKDKEEPDGVLPAAGVAVRGGEDRVGPVVNLFQFLLLSIYPNIQHDCN